MKICKKCFVEKEIKYFLVNKNFCSDCRKKYHQEYRLKNLEKEKKRCKDKYYKNIEKYKLLMKKYYENNKDKLKKNMLNYYYNNLDKIKQYREKNKEKIALYAKEKYKSEKLKIFNEIKNICK